MVANISSLYIYSSSVILYQQDSVDHCSPVDPQDEWFHMSR